jgi:hypothetical protein
MFRTRAAATCIAIAVSFGGATAALAPAALASSSHTATATGPDSTGAFGSWAKAQSAAGFSLKKPTRLHGLARSSSYDVSKCTLAGKPSKRVVDVQYGKLKKGLLAIGQNNSGGLCSNLGGAKKLGTVKLNGTTGHLYGLCGKKGLVSCSSKKAAFTLTWKKGSVFYNTSSENETRATLIDFSKSLKNV